MFSVIFPGQGSQMVGMGKEFFDKFDLVKDLFKEADDTLNFSISRLIFEGPKEELDLTINTQPAIFIISYSIYNVINKQFNIDLNKAKYFSGHSDVMVGTLAVNKKVFKKVNFYNRVSGYRASPDDAYLVIRGLRTLDVRL